MALGETGAGVKKMGEVGATRATAGWNQTAGHEGIRGEVSLRVLVETGTCRGDMVEAMKKVFDRIYSIELSQALFEESQKRFRSQPHIRILQGDSGKVLGDVLKEISEPALFWLDSHYSGGDTARGSCDTPIYDELKHILDEPGSRHVIIIDDARCFGTDPAYPRVEDLKQFVLSKCSSLGINIATDSIRITPAV
jgi:hypothetical protein